MYQDYNDLRTAMVKAMQARMEQDMTDLLETVEYVEDRPLDPTYEPADDDD